MSAAEHERLADGAAAYVLGALPELEERAFARHVMGCSECREEVERLGAAAAALPRAVTPLNPPPGLRRSIMAVVEAEAAAPDRAGRRPRLPHLRELVRTRLGSRLRPAAAWASAAFVLAAGALAGLAAGELLGGAEERRVAASVDESRLADGSGTLIIPEDEDRAILSVHGVPTLPDADSNEVYQLWLVRGNEVIPSSLMTVGADGSGTAAISEGLEDVDAVWVTREGPGGSRAPTERPVMSVTLD